MKDNTNELIKYNSTTPPKEGHFTPPFAFVPDYTFGATLNQTNIEIDTPQFQSKTQMTSLLHPNGGRGRTSNIVGRGRGGGHISTNIQKSIINQAGNNMFVIKDNTKTNINNTNTIITSNSKDNNITREKSHQNNESNIEQNHQSNTTTEYHINNLPPNSIDKKTIEMEELDNKGNFDNETINQTLQSTRNANTVTFKPLDKTQLDHQHIFCLYISFKEANKNDEMSRETITEHILTSLQQANPNIKLLSAPNSYYPRLSTNSIYQNAEIFTKQHVRYICDLFTNSKGTISGNHWFNSPTIYSTIKRDKLYRKHIGSKYSVYTAANRLNAPRPIVIGYFIHRLVRHDTVEDTNYTRSFLSPNSPCLQQDQTTIWVGPPGLKRSTGVVTISTRPEEAKQMTTIMEQSFKNRNNMTFISKLLFNSLDTINRLQYVEGQIQYRKTHCSIIF
jgi:hypothetical protein